MLVIAAMSLMSFTTKSVCEQTESTQETFANTPGWRTITVDKITKVGANGAAAIQSFQAEFDIDNMELRVVERHNGKNYTMSYSVVRNPYKGYSDDPRGRYNYCADHYFFN